MNIEILKEKFGSKAELKKSSCSQDWIYCDKEILTQLASWLKDELKFAFLIDLTCVDYKGYPGKETSPRFEMVYQFYSHETKERVGVKVPLEETSPNVASLTSLWKAADWYEREVYDMYGIHFSGHNDLRRILMYEEFKGHPLRKDYPLKARQPRIPHED